jgi:hypothetical protein
MGEYIMPTYTFHNSEADTTEEHYLKISELDEFKNNNPHLKQKLSVPSIGDSVQLGVTKTPDSFNSLLKHIKKGNSKGFTDSTIKTR